MKMEIDRRANLIHEKAIFVSIHTLSELKHL